MTSTILSYRGFRACIVDKGALDKGNANTESLLPVYGINIDEETHHVSCWVASEEKHAFSVHWENKSAPDVVTAAFIYLDGYKVPGRFLMGIGRCYRDGVRSGPKTQKPFVFEHVGQPSVSRNLGERSDAARSYEPGSVVLRIKKVKILREASPHPANKLQALPDPLVNTADGSEQVIGFGHTETCPEQHSSTWRCTSEGNYVTFTFHYRPKAFLQAMGWCTADSPPTPASSEEHSPPYSASTANSQYHSSQGSLLEGSSALSDENRATPPISRSSSTVYSTQPAHGVPNLYISTDFDSRHVPDSQPPSSQAYETGPVPFYNYGLASRYATPTEPVSGYSGATRYANLSAESRGPSTVPSPVSRNPSGNLPYQYHRTFSGERHVSGAYPGESSTYPTS